MARMNSDHGVFYCSDYVNKFILLNMVRNCGVRAPGAARASRYVTRETFHRKNQGFPDVWTRLLSAISQKEGIQSVLTCWSPRVATLTLAHG